MVIRYNVRMEVEAWVGMKNRNMKNLKFGLDVGFIGLLYNIYGRTYQVYQILHGMKNY